MKNKFIITLFLLSVSYTQVYDVGDIVPSDFGLPWCGNNTTGNDSLFAGVRTCVYRTSEQWEIPGLGPIWGPRLIFLDAISGAPSRNVVW